METLNLMQYFLVTGGSGGMGSAICKQLSLIGITPIIGYKSNADLAEKIAMDTGGFTVKLDMSDEASISNALNIIQESLKENDLLAGVILGASPPPDLLPFSRLSSQHYLDQFQVNVNGPQVLLSLLIKNFFRKKKAGQIIGILSNAIGSNDKAPATGMGAYIVAKSAMQSLLSVCLAEYPWLNVSSVSPGFTDTKMLEVFDKRYLELVAATNPISHPDEVAKTIINKIKI